MRFTRSFLLVCNSRLLVGRSVSPHRTAASWNVRCAALAAARNRGPKDNGPRGHRSVMDVSVVAYAAKPPGA